MKKSFFILLFAAFLGLNSSNGQWNVNGSHIYNTNTGFVGIGNNSPTSLLHVQKNMIEPMITVQNLGGNGGATYTMIDNASGANWKFKATLSGGFKIRDHANLMDVIVIEPNSFANALYIKSTDNIGIGTATPANSALVDMTSANKGLLPPRMSSGQISSIADPADGLMVYNTTDKHLYIYISTANAWMKLSYEIELSSCGSTFTISHIAGDIAPVSKTVTYGTVLTDLTGSNKCWITQNLGADHQATSATDNTEASAGWYWQFNRQQGFKHDGTTRTPNSTWITSINENSDWVPANDPCVLLLGPSWRLPTATEWFDADANGGWDNYTETFASVLKLHTSGTLDGSNGALANRGTAGLFFSSTQGSNTSGWRVYFSTGGCDVTSSGLKHWARTLRCLMN
jgi:hypothetical protein